MLEAIQLTKTYKGGHKVAVEAETGKAKLDIVMNVRKNVGVYDEVWSVPLTVGAVLAVV